MKVYVSDRQTGKTTKLIRESAKTGATIAVANYSMISNVKYLAKQLDLIIPEPVTYHTMFMDYVKNKSKRYLVDELQMMLGQLNVDVATLDTRVTELMDFVMNNEED